MSENLIVISISLFFAIAGIVSLVFYHDPLTMPMQLSPKVPAPSRLDRFLLRLSWLRKPWELSSAATEIVISRALAEPRLAYSIEAALVLALRHKHKRTTRHWSDIWDAMNHLPATRGPNELTSLDWLVPGSPEDVFWSIQGKRLDVCAKWHSGIEIGSNGISIPNDLIPASIRTSLAGRRFGDLFDLPFVRPDRIIAEHEVKHTSKGVNLDIFHDARTMDEIRNVLDVIAKTKTIPGLTVKRK